MKLLINENNLINYKSRELIPLECYNCKKTFYKAKHYIQKVLKGESKSKLLTCNIVCRGLYKTHISSIIINCNYCNKEIISLINKKKTRKFCSKSCSNRARSKNISNKKIRTIRIKKEKIFCKCLKSISHKNITGLCKTCYLLSDKAMEQRGRTFSKTRKYKLNPFTNNKFYIMSSLEELFFDLCVKNNIYFEKPKTIYYRDGLKNRYYFPDFYLPFINLIVEIKGFLTKEDALKMQLIKNQYPELKIKILYKNEINNFIFDILKKNN